MFCDFPNRDNVVCGNEASAAVEAAGDAEALAAAKAGSGCSSRGEAERDAHMSMRIDLEVLNSVDHIITTDIMQSGDESE